jgi:16S rRNA C967 or C1407 C5-methylase (RsmB/RsmF family)
MTLADIAAQLSDGAAFMAQINGPFRRAFRVHPRRGKPTGWDDLQPVPWSAQGLFTAAHNDPGQFLDYHTGTIYPQDAASQVPVLLLNPQPGEIIIDTCAAPGSKTTQIGLALGDDGLVVALDAAAPRRRIIGENLARQGITCAVVTPMPLHVLAERHPAVADGVLVDAPCSGHEEKSAKQIARMAERQLTILSQAALLVASGGRLVYSTCTPYMAENEGVVQQFLKNHAGWVCEKTILPGCDTDLAQLGALRLWPQRQGTEPFFACLLRAPEHGRHNYSLSGRLPSAIKSPYFDRESLLTWVSGRTYFVATQQAAACALPSEARGLMLGHDAQELLPWAAQAAIERGAETLTITHADALALWRGDSLSLSIENSLLLKTAAGSPLGQAQKGADGHRLMMPSRLMRAGLR